MKITITQLRRIIKEEVQNAVTTRGKTTLREGHSRITSRELEEWKKGNWMFEAMDEKSCSECGAPMQYSEGDDDSCSECGASNNAQ